MSLPSLTLPKRESLIQPWLSFFSFPSLQSDSQLSRLIWLIRFRWMAIALFFILSGPALVFGFLNAQTVPVFLAIIGFLFVFNLLTQLIFAEPGRNVGAPFIGLQLSLDVIALASLLLMTGGFANPFTGLFLLNAALGGLLIVGPGSWAFLALTHLLLGLLQFSYVNAFPFSLDLNTKGYLVVGHALVFGFWLVMRSLGRALEKQSEFRTQARLQMERQDRLRALGSLAAGFSHEFASPLNAAKLRLDRLRRVDPQNDDVEAALKAIGACEQVIHQMNSSQLDARDFQFKHVAINDLIKDVLESWQESEPTAKVDLQLGPNEKLRLPPVNFAQVLLNLMDNAFEANQELGKSSAAIEVSFKRTGNVYQLQVSDEGRGFPETVLQRLGEAFVTTKPNGTGLGLYVTGLFCQSLGGGLVLERSRSGGASVRLTWPVTALEVL